MVSVMYVCVKPSFEKTKSPEVIRKLELSAMETQEMKYRHVFCPHCGIHIIDVFEDIHGHFAIKCLKCKGTVLINAAYFHRSDAAARRKRRTSGLRK